MRRELERLLNLASALTQKGSLPASGDSIVSSLESQWYTMGELVDQCSTLVDMRSTSRHTKRGVSSRAKTAVVKEREAETAHTTHTNADDTSRIFVGSVSARDDDENQNYGEFFCPNLWEEVLKEPDVCDTTIYVMGKINTLCDTLLREQESCVQFIKSRDDTISQTEDLVETLEDLQVELKSYRDLLINDLSHAPAMNLILKGIQKDVGRLLNVAEKLTRSGVLPEDGGMIVPSLESQWYLMRDLMNQLSILIEMPSTNPRIDPELSDEVELAVAQGRASEVNPLNSNQRNEGTDPEEAMTTFGVFIASEDRCNENTPMNKFTVNTPANICSCKRSHRR